MKGVKTLQLKEILTEVDLLAPNSVSQEHKIRFINQIQNELFREIHVKTAVYSFNTVPGTELYDLAADCQPENVLNVYVNDKEYSKKTFDDSNFGNLYMMVNGQLQIRPTPDAIYEGQIYYYANPIQLSATNLDTVPDLPSDFHELLSIGCAKKVAMAMKDFDSMKVFAEQYANMVRDAIIKLSPKPSRVIRKRHWA